MSQSSGCAPNAMTRSGTSCASSAAAGRSRNRLRRSMLDVSELVFPDRLALLIKRRAAQDREQRADGGALGDVLHLAVLDTRQESLNRIVGDVAAGGYRLRVLGPLVVHHAAARSFDRALGAGELL